MIGSEFVTQSSIFRPTLYSGCAFWFDASDLSSFALNGSNGAELWRDKSPSGLHVTQGTSANCPALSGTLNGRPVLNFDGTNDRLFNATGFPTEAPSGIAIFLVIKYTSDASFRALIDNNHSTGGFVLQNTNANRLMVYNSSSISFNSSTDIGDGTWKLISVSSISNKRTELRVNRALNAGLDHPSTAIGNLNSVLSIGAWHNSGAPARFLSCQLAEAFAYRAPLDPAQVQNAENYLSEKWGLP